MALKGVGVVWSHAVGRLLARRSGQPSGLHGFPETDWNINDLREAKDRPGACRPPGCRLKVFDGLGSFGAQRLLRSAAWASVAVLSLTAPACTSDSNSSIGATVPPTIMEAGEVLYSGNLKVNDQGIRAWVSATKQVSFVSRFVETEHPELPARLQVRLVGTGWSG